MKKLNICLILIFLLLAAPSFCQGLKDPAVRKIMLAVYLRDSMDEFQAKAKSSGAKWDMSNMLLEPKKSFEDFLRAKRPPEILPKDLENIFTLVMKQSLEEEEKYYLKQGWGKLPITTTCNLFAYFTARSVVRGDITLGSDEYTLKDTFLIRVDPIKNTNAYKGTGGGFLDIPQLKSSTGSKNFKHEDGRTMGVWNYHMVSVFVVEDTKGRIYLIVPDPLLYNRSVSLAEWIERFYKHSVVDIQKFAEDSDLNARRLPKPVKK